jgi:hypothetical protein
MLQSRLLSRLFIFQLAAIALSTTLFGQNSNKDIKCNVVSEFLDSLDNTSNFHYLPKDTTLIFLDPNDLIKESLPDRWHTYRISIVKQGSIIDSLRRFDPHFVLKGRCQYFILALNHNHLLSQKHDKRGFNLNLYQPCSNEFSEAEIKSQKGKYYIATIRFGVY